MRLRIKKTGEVVDAFSIDARNYETIKIQYYTKDGVLNHFSFDSLEKMNDVLEDYKPAEPLIKDEKIRKAVRAWAETEGSNSITVEPTYGERSLIIRAENGLAFWTSNKNSFEGLEVEKSYTIAELCGDEEEDD